MRRKKAGERQRKKNIKRNLETDYSLLTIIELENSTTKEREECGGHRSLNHRSQNRTIASLRAGHIPCL